MPKEIDNEEVKDMGGCKCPNCGCSLAIVSGENYSEDEQSFSKLDDEDQRGEMEKDFKKKMGKLEEYG